MAWRYDAEAEQRLPPDPQSLGTQLRNRDHYLGWSFHGPFWQLREWLGFEGLCMMTLDDPEFVHDMVEFWTEFVARLLRRGLAYVTPDEVHISEDMAFKCHAMISPAMTREFLKPAYDRWAAILRDAGVKVFAVDSDGYIGDLIPIWIDSGFNVCDPIEVAAGNDIVAFRKEYGKAIGYRGGVDKRAMAKGGDTLKAEIDRIAPVVEDGGYIPSCDHGVPADVSWQNYLQHTRLLAQVTGWL
jgi:uroporphyrinogen decarboxylase